MAKRRVLLVHWNATEARARAARLRDAGYTVRIHSKEADGEGFKRVRAHPPDAVVIDLDRLPSHGRACGVWLRQTKPTRHVPILYVGGDDERIARTRKLLPDAVFSSWRRVRGDLRRAVAAPAPGAPVVPDTMAGYSRTPLAKKLTIREGKKVALLEAPDDFGQTLGSLPDGVTLRRGARGTNDLVMLFARTRARLEALWPRGERALAERGGIWIAWPKKTSKLAKDLGEADVRAYGLERGFVDYKICAIDATWSGLLFTRRRA